MEKAVIIAVQCLLGATFVGIEAFMLTHQLSKLKEGVCTVVHATAVAGGVALALASIAVTVDVWWSVISMGAFCFGALALDYILG